MGAGLEPSRTVSPTCPARNQRLEGVFLMSRYVLKGYPESPSVEPGAALRLYIACMAAPDDAPETEPFPATEFAITIYRQGANLELVAPQSDWRPCPLLPPGPPDAPWHESAWRDAGHSIPIPHSWRSGVYIAVLTGCQWPPTPASDGRSARLLFVVLPARDHPARILYKLPLNTYHAYNDEGGGSLYDDPVPGATGLPCVTVQRPGGGIGGRITPGDYACPDAYDCSSPRQTFAHWDRPFLAWLESQGDPVDYCTDLDLDALPHLLDGYNLLISAGHDEYWSDGMCANASRFIADGGNMAFFGGNTCWWRIEYNQSRTTFTCDKVHWSGDGFLGNWWVLGRPENRLTGVSYRAGGARWDGPRQRLGYTVLRADHWVFEKTGLNNGDVFGEEEALIGYECDGESPSGTPPGFTALGYAGPLDDTWQDLPGNETGQSRTGYHHATMGLYSAPGFVFTASTTDWPRVLATNPEVQAITRNIIQMSNLKKM
jgi:hypothetical protein